LISRPRITLKPGLRSAKIVAFELLACVFGYLALNGVAVLNVGSDPGWTSAVHIVALPAVIFIAWRSWQRMSQR
jgi:hypothetical protein